MCRSAKGDGSEFCATFRVTRAAALPKALEPDQNADVEVIARRRWRVLVAEDNRTNRMVLHHILRSYDLDLIWVENGEEAVESCLRERPDLVLMDVNMPLMDGVTAARHIRTEERVQDRTPVPIIAVSANALVHQVRHYLENGMSDHVAKPIRKDRLLRVMAQALLDAPTAERGG